MKPIASPLRILDFAITMMDFGLVFADRELSLSAEFERYEVDIDFDMIKEGDLRVFIRASVNQGPKKLAGYTLKAEAVCLFELDGKRKLKESEQSSIEGFSTIYIALNSLRGLISNFTANAPFGRYILPSIDLNDLIEKKRISLTEARAMSNRKKKGVTGNPKAVVEKGTK